MLRKTNDQNKINFLNPNAGILPDVDKAKENKELTEAQKLDILAEEQKSRKLNCKDDNGYTNSHSISSATYSPDVISNDSGPSKQMKTPISNSIWEPDRNVSASISDSKEETRKEKETIAALKAKQKKERTDAIVEALKSTDTTKASAVTSMDSYQGGSQYISPKNNMSIFDNSEFERLPEKTEGEIVAEENALKRAQKDESWRNNGKSFSSKDVVDRLFDGLMSSFEKKE